MQLPVYPGRGLVVGRTGNDTPCTVYWVTGRSPASKLRTLRVGGQRVEVIPRSGKASDPLRHYTAVVASRDTLVVGNGAHVEEISTSPSIDDMMATFIKFEYEPDKPIWTPRIAGGMWHANEIDEVIWVGAARRAAHHQLDHIFLRAGRTPPGFGLSVWTYDSDGERVDTRAEPTWVRLGDDLTSVANDYWDRLDERFRVGVAAVSVGYPPQVVKREAV